MNVIPTPSRFFALLLAATVVLPLSISNAQGIEDPDVSSESQVYQGDPSAPSQSLSIDDEGPRRPFGIWRVGGSLGLGGTRDFFYVDVSPLVSYMMWDRLEPGLGFIYQFSLDSAPSPSIKRHTVGGRMTLRFYIIPSLFIEGEGQLVSTGIKQGGVKPPRLTLGTGFAGGGYAQPLGGNAHLFVSIKVNLNTNELYPDHRPFISAGIGIGL